MAFRKPTTPKRDRTGEFASIPKPTPAVARMWSAGLAQAAGMMGVPPKIDKRVRKRQDIRDSANGEACLMSLPGCLHHAILSHNRHLHAGKGRGMKAPDVSTAYACAHCDSIYDKQTKRPLGWTEDMVELAWYRAHDQTLVKFAQKGLL